MKFWENELIMTLIGIVIGAVIGFAGTIYSSHLKLKELENQHAYQLELRSIEKKEEISVDIIQSIYSLKKMDDGLIDIDLQSFKEESYTIFARANIYSDPNVVDLYNKFLTTFFTKQIYDGQLVENELIPAIRKDLNVDNADAEKQ